MVGDGSGSCVGGGGGGETFRFVLVGDGSPVDVGEAMVDDVLTEDGENDVVELLTFGAGGVAFGCVSARA